MRFANRIVAIVMVFVLLEGAVFAREQGHSSDATKKVHAKVLKLFDQGARIKVELSDGRKLRGAISELNDTAFVLVDESRMTTIAYGEVVKVKKEGSSFNHKVLVSLGVAAGLLGLAVYAAHQDR